MLSSQTFPDQPIASSSNSGGSKPRLILRVLQPLQSASVVPFSNALPSAPPAAKKMWHVAFECSTHLSYPLISIMDRIPSILPTGLQPIYEDAYLTNSSPEVLDRVAADEWKDIFGHYPSCEYCALHNLQSTCSLRPNSLSCATCKVNYPSSKNWGLFTIWDEEWTALTMGLRNVPYYGSHPEELGLSSDRLKVPEGKRKAVVSSTAFRKSQLLQQERELLGELSHEQVILALSCKGKEVVRDPVDIDVEMEAPDAMESMELDYPEEVPSTSALVPAAPAPALTKPAVIWKVNDRQSYREVSSLKTWFFEPLVKPVPSNGTILSRDDMIRAAIECIVTRVAELLSGCGKVMMEQDLWALADGLVQGIFNDLEEQMKHPSSDPPAPFSNSGLTQFVESLLMINLSSANIKSDHLETKNLHLQEQVSSRDGQLEEKDEELTHLKSFVRHFKGDIPSSEIQQLREALEGQKSEIKKELKSQDEELAQLRQLFKSVRGQFAAASPSKPSSSSS
ncbi:hypothetical protein GYMLUDRAFT_250374 [Collybiopsis luxurians FD-317 M1]|uniref:Uncharacterized protein n=1 Tax=Collybiopsis luxurians FD-317 M1 TaxID=944289 RepID=A0A0D0CEK8_9AGAR|nr:hypothetical protein GYMLUDRAFT_250374 [Collybiopsis luxurians FD-317 M1]